MRIEKIIHQTWKSRDIPHDVYRKEWVDSWKTLHPGWEYVLWTDEDNRALIRQEFPWFLETYDRYPAAIHRADVIRYFILYARGGVYADLDYLCLKNLEPLLGDHRLVLSYMGKDMSFLHCLTNAIMASSRGLPFWRKVFCELQKVSGRATIVEDLTGPMLLRRVVSRYTAPRFWRPRTVGTDLKIYESDYLCPIDHRHHALGRRTMPQDMIDHPGICFPDACAVTYWAHHWEDPYYRDRRSA